MPLADMEWTEISIHQVVLEFLRGEQATTKFPAPPEWQPVIDHPNLSDPLENQKRLRLLYVPRAQFMIEIPSDTTWWQVRGLAEHELSELYTSAKHDKKCQGYAPSPASLPMHSGERNSTPRGRKLGRRLPGAVRRADLSLATEIGRIPCSIGLC
jgi:hypothetical protein